MMWLLTLWGGVKRLFDIALRYPWQAALVVSLCLAGWFYMGKQDALADLADEQSAHIATKVNYANAQKVAADMNRKQVERIENEYEAIAANSERNYDALLADSRSNLADWMRRSKTAQSSASRAGTGETATVSGEPMQDAAQAEFLVRADDLEIAAENYAQLMALRSWAIEVGKVDTDE